MSEPQTEAAERRGVRVISGEAVVDLSHLTEPGELAAISRIERVAVVIVPEALAGAYAAIPTAHVASTLYVPGGANTRVQTGSLVVGGDGLGGADDVLVVIGLLAITSPVVSPVPKSIHVVGSVLAPRGSEQVLGPALAGGTGSVTYYPYADGQQIKVLSGHVRLSPAMLANTAGRPDDILVVAGQVVVSGEVTSVGFGTVVVAGQFAAPASSRDVLEPAIESQGQAAWYESASPRIFNTDARLGPDFLRLLEAPTALVVLGDLIVEEGATEAGLREKISALTVFGDVIAPPGLVGIMQILATDVLGDIKASDDGGGDGPDGSRR
ncbi:MAG TPA: hypothetical protein VHZ33_30070 [Trebonia sp.]|jgi:hypothetical protein|nr:hypothetical protein [Trebonia sp.]